eukprot:567083-Pyramimonas_sp.AAC.1
MTFFHTSDEILAGMSGKTDAAVAKRVAAKVCIRDSMVRKLLGLGDKETEDRTLSALNLYEDAPLSGGASGVASAARELLKVQCPKKVVTVADMAEGIGNVDPGAVVAALRSAVGGGDSVSKLAAHMPMQAIYDMKDGGHAFDAADLDFITVIAMGESSIIIGYDEV